MTEHVPPPKTFAFPLVRGQSMTVQTGMTLRDYFAAKAMAALTPTYRVGSDSAYREVATEAYRIADAMMEKRG